MAKSTSYQVQQFPKVRQLHKIGEVGKCNYLSITYILSNNFTKNYYNRIPNIQVIVEDVTWIFLKHSVVVNYSDRHASMGNWSAGAMSI